MSLANDQAEEMAGRVAVDPPGHRLAVVARPGRDVLAGRRGAGLDHPVVGGRQVRDQDVEVDRAVSGASEVAVAWKESR